MKTMLLTCFDIKGIVHFYFTPQGQTFNQASYMEIPKQLLEGVHKKMLKFGPLIGFYSMTMLKLTKRSLSSNSSPSNRLL
jgi:hypothetical protein